MNPFADAAWQYRKAGWLGTIPLPPRSKALSKKGWTGHEGRTPSGADVQEWIDTEPGESNIALRMPYNVVGIDVDDYGLKKGSTTLDGLAEKFGPLPATWRSTARPIGRSGIYFFRIPEGLWWPGKLGDAIEVIQYAHRYAVVSPSWNPDAGAQYGWHRDIGDDGIDVIPSVDELPWLPDAWVQGITNGEALTVERKATIPHGGVGRWIDRNDHDGEVDSMCHMMRGDVMDAQKAFTRGARHDVLLSHSMRIIRTADGGHRGLRTALGDLRTAFEMATAAPERGAARDTRALDSEWSRAIEGAIGRVLASSPRAAGEDVRPCTCDEDSLSLVGGVSYAGPLVFEFTGIPVGQVGSPPDSADTWIPLDLGPYLRGEVAPVIPTVGALRSDGMRFLYPGREHACIGESEAGKSWFALACVAAELHKGNRVLYIHFEEADPSDTVKRLLLLGVLPSRIESSFIFVGPASAITSVALARLIETPPTLVILDGQNEAMALHRQDIMAPDGAAMYRSVLVKPFTAVGASVLSLDHVPKDTERSGNGYAMGSAHKMNGLTGAAFLLENREPFGRGRRGRSSIYISKDRPGELRRKGKPTTIGRKFHIGEMVVDSEAGFSFMLWAPKADEIPVPGAMSDDPDDPIVLAAIAELNRRGITATKNMVRGEAKLKATRVDEALIRLELAGLVTKANGARNSQVFTIIEKDEEE